MAFFGLIGGRTVVERPAMEGDALLEQLARHLAAQAFGDGEITEGTAVPGGQRDRFIRYTPLGRAVSLVSGFMSQLLCGSALTIRDREDNLVNGRRTDRIMELLTHSPDGGVTPGHTFIEDCASDYLLDGNALIRPTMLSNMMPAMLTRYRPHGAHTVRDGGPLAYQAQPAHGVGELETIPARDMMHIRWPLMQRGQLGEHGREHFAVAPVTLFARALITGMLQDAYARGRFEKAPLAALLLSHENERLEKMEPKQKAQLLEVASQMLANSPVLASLQVKGTELAASPVHEHVIASRDFQVREVAAMYGLPLPLMSAPIGQWTRGVNEQVMKMAWRSGVRQHVDRFLAPFKTRLLLPGERFEVDPAEMVRGDASSIAELVMALQGDAQRDPVASRNELRRISGLPAQVDGTIVSTRREEKGSMDDQN